MGSPVHNMVRGGPVGSRQARCPIWVRVSDDGGCPLAEVVFGHFPRHFDHVFWLDDVLDARSSVGWVER